MPRVSRRHLVDLFERRVSDYPRALGFSPDGTRLGIGVADGALLVLDARDGRTLFETKLPDTVSAVAFAPDNEGLAVGCHDGLARLYDRAGALKAELPSGGRNWVEHLAWSSTSVLAAAAGKTVRLWSSKGEPVLETAAHPSTITGLAFSSDGQRLFTASYGGVRVWTLDAAASRALAWKGSLISLALSPKDDVVACGSQDCSVHFWRLALSEAVDSEMRGYPAKPASLAWSADGGLLATTGAQTICVWRFEGDGPEGSKPWVLKGHEKLVTQLAFARNERLLASAGDDGDILLWSLGEGLKPAGLAPMSGAVSGLRFSPDDGLLAAADANGLVRVFRPMKETRS